MSWLGTNLTGGLSNITGQISSFTREMLTEGTEEVADVSAELKIARERIQELEAVISSQRSEYESVKSQNAELHDRVEAAELQTQKMKQDYRSQIENKERELIELREQLQEKEHWQYDVGIDTRGYGGSVSGDDDTEAHRLQRELTKLPRENAQLKKETVSEQESEKLHIKQIDHHHQELASLQASHSEKIASLTRKYKNDMQLWQKEKEDFLNTIEELEGTLQEHRNSDETTVGDKICDIATLKQELDVLRDGSRKSEAEVFNWKSSAGKLEEEIDIIKQQKKELEVQLEKCSLSEQQKCCSLEKVKEEIGLLSSATEELMEELEVSHTFQKEQKVEIESLKKICTIKGDVTHEVVRLKDALTALWERYVNIMGQYQKVRLELHTSNQRLLAQLQTHVRDLRQDFSITQNKILDSNMDKLDQVHQEKQALMLMSSEVSMCVEEQESAVIDLYSDNEQVLQEAKQCVAEIGCEAVSEDESANLVSSLQAEKALLETTIVGLEHKVQDLNEELQSLKGMGPSEHEMENDYELLESRDSMCHAKELAKNSDQLVQGNGIEEAELDGNDMEGQLKKQDLIVSNLQHELEEYKRFAEVYEEDKAALEEAIVDTRKLLKQSDKKNQAVTAENERLLHNFRDLSRVIGKKLNIAVENDGIRGFETEVERFEEFSVQLKEWVKRYEDNETADTVDSGSGWSCVSLDEKSHTDNSGNENNDSLRQTIAELELSRSVLREETEKVIAELQSQTTCVATLRDELDEKCRELQGLQNERVNFVAQLTEKEQIITDIQESFEAERLDLTTSRDESINVLQEEQQDMLNVLQEKQKETAALKNDNHRLMSLLQDKQQENDDLVDKNQSLDSLVKESEMLLEEIKSEKETILSQLNENLQVKNNLSNDYTTLSEENQNLKESMRDLKQKLEFNEEQTAKELALNLEVENLKAKLKDSVKEKKSLEENINILNLAKGSIQGSLESRNKELHTLKTALNEKTSEVDLFASEQDRLNKVISTTGNRVKELEQRLDFSVSEKEELLQSLHSKDVEIGQLQLDVREKGAENDLLRLDLARVSKTLKEKEQVLHLSSSSEKDAPEHMEQKLKTMLKLIEEKDYEMEALKQKDASLMEIVTESDKSGAEIREHYEEQIQQLRSERERILAELDHKDEELLTVNDRMAAMKEKMSGKDQASAMLHSEHMKLVSLNQSQGNEIAKLREKNDALLKLLEERDKAKRHEDVNRIQDENNRLSQQISALHSEQERLLVLVHEKDKQLQGVFKGEDSDKEVEITGLRGEISRLRVLLNEKNKLVVSLTDRNDNLEEQVDKLTESDGSLKEKDYEISCLKEKVASLSVLTSSHEMPSSQHLENVLKEKEELSQQLFKIRQECEEALNGKEQFESKFQEELLSLSQSVSEKEKELRTLCEKSNKDKIDLERLRLEKEALDAINAEKQVEVQRLQARIQQVSSDQQHDNMSTLNDVAGEYEQLVQDKEKKIDQLLAEKSRQEQNAQVLTQRVASLERELSVAVNKKMDADDKLKKELERLRGHLIMVEESYTREALLAEERERDLGERLERAEEQLVSSSSSLKVTNRQATQQRESLQEQLHAIASQRDEAIMQLSSAQEQAQQYAMALQNLQMVLEQFQREKDDQFSLAREQAQKEIEEAKAENVRMHQREADLRSQLGSAARVLQEVGVLKQQLLNKDEEIANWKVEVNKLEEGLRTSHQKIKDLHTNNDAKVDKVLLKNLLLSYFHTPEAKRSDAVHVLGGLLDFTPEEMAQVGSGSSGGGGWISSLLPFGGTPKTPTHKQPVGTPTKASAVDKSFSELFVSFLQNESESNSPLQAGAAMSRVTNPLLHGISPHQAPLSQGQPSNMLYQPPTGATPTGSRFSLGQTPHSGTRPLQSHPGPTHVSSSVTSSLPSSAPGHSPGPFATPQNSRSAAVPLRLVSPVRPGQELPSLIGGPVSSS